MGTLNGKPQKSTGKSESGFFDPDEIYPRYEDGEQDTNRLARGEKIDKTPVQWRKDNVDIADQALRRCF